MKKMPREIAVCVAVLAAMTVASCSGLKGKRDMTRAIASDSGRDACGLTQYQLFTALAESDQTQNVSGNGDSLTSQTYPFSEKCQLIGQVMGHGGVTSDLVILSLANPDVAALLGADADTLRSIWRNGANDKGNVPALLNTLGRFCDIGYQGRNPTSDETKSIKKAMDRIYASAGASVAVLNAACDRVGCEACPKLGD